MIERQFAKESETHGELKNSIGLLMYPIIKYGSYPS